MVLVILLEHNYNTLMQITAIKTHALLPGKETDILTVIDQYVDCHSGKPGTMQSPTSQVPTGTWQRLHQNPDPGPQSNAASQARMTEKIMLTEGSVLAVTSKIVSICEGRYVKEDEVNKEELVAKEAEMYIPRFSKYEFTVTITNGILGASAGIDASNGNGYFILWPKNPQESVNRIREHIAKRLGLRDFGVVITDSKTTSMRWGVTGIALAHSGFAALKDYIGTPDIFGRDFQYEKLNVADCIATAAVLAMGEGKEQTPLALVSDIPTISFQDRNPTGQELEALKIGIEDDFYGPFLKNAPWIKKKLE